VLHSLAVYAGFVATYKVGLDGRWQGRSHTGRSAADGVVAAASQDQNGDGQHGCDVEALIPVALTQEF
jgi:hypothetical protein